MSVPCVDFWKLLKLSRLVSPERLEQLEASFSRSPVATDRTTGPQLAQWLVRRGVLTRYQADQLLKGRSGPFFYGDYQAQLRERRGRLRGLFQATHIPTRHGVLLKFPHPQLAQDPRQWPLVRRYTRSACALVDPHLQRVFALDEHSGYRFLVLELLTGDSLDVLLAEHKRLPVAQVCRFARMVALGLARLHGAGQVDGDVRPENCWLETDGTAKLMRDRFLPPVVPDMARAHTRQTAGDRGDYWAPELVHSAAPLNALTDIYALGCTVYQLLSGVVPFPGGDAAEKMRRHATDPPPSLARWEVPREVIELVDHMMAKSPRDRLASVGDVAARFGELIDSPDSLPPRPPPPPTLVALEHWLRGTSQPISGSSAPASESRLLRDNWTLILSVTAGVVVLAITGLLVVDFIARLHPPARRARATRQDSPTGTAGDTSPSPSPGAEPASRRPISTAGPNAVWDDDGTMLWMTPTRGVPISLAHLPPGPQWILAARPAEWVSRAGGQQTLRALGPAFDRHRQLWEAAAGFSFEQIDLLVMSVHDAGLDFPRAAFVVQLRQPLPEQTLVAAWEHPPRVAHAGAHYYRGDRWSYLIVTAPGNSRFLMAAEPDVQDVMQVAGAPPVVRREMTRLLNHSDSDRHLTVVCAPSFLQSNLFRDGREYYFGDASRLRKPLAWLLDDSWRACSFSLHLDDRLYAELRAYGDSDHDAAAMADALRQRWDQIPGRIEAYLEQVYPPPYWRRVALRLPAMVRLAGSRARVGIEHDQAITNVVLPAEAAHNLAFAFEMMLAEPSVADDLPHPTPAFETPESIEELLNAAMNVTFDQKSLEFALRDLVDDLRTSFPQLPFGFDIRIEGSELQLEGITRNQQISNFVAEHEPLSDVLTRLVMRANPITTVTSPSDPDQKLIWVIGPDSDDAHGHILLISTRDAARRNQLNLPAAFQP